jgi:hypothetical protein
MIKTRTCNWPPRSGPDVAFGLQVGCCSSINGVSGVRVRRDTLNFVDLYRVVSSAELADIQATGQFRIPVGGVEGNYFVYSLQDARYFRDEVISRIDQSQLSVVHTIVSMQTLSLFEQAIMDSKTTVFVPVGCILALNMDARRYGIREVE